MGKAGPLQRGTAASDERRRAVAAGGLEAGSCILCCNACLDSAGG